MAVQLISHLQSQTCGVTLGERPRKFADDLVSDLSAFLYFCHASKNIALLSFLSLVEKPSNISTLLEKKYV